MTECFQINTINCTLPIIHLDKKCFCQELRNLNGNCEHYLPLRFAKIILLFIIFLKGSLTLRAQTIERFNTFSYNVNEGLLQSHADDMAFDKNNFGWLSFSNGIQKFDGNRFINIPVQPGLPDDKSTALFTTSTGDLLIGHSQGISKYNVSNNKFTLIYRNEPQCLNPVLFLGEDNGTVYFFTDCAAIVGIDVNTFLITSSTSTGFKNFKNDGYFKLRTTANIINHTIGLYTDSSLTLWDLAGKKELYQVRNTLVNTYFSIHLCSQYELLYFNNSRGSLMMKYDFKAGTTNKVAEFAGDKDKSPRTTFFEWKKKWHLSYFDKIYETDSSFTSLLKELKNFRNEPLTGGYVTNLVRTDKLGNLYLLTANNGIRRIANNNYKINYYGNEKKTTNFTVSICADKRANRVLIGTQGNGLLVFDTLQQLVKNIPNLPGDKDGFTPTCIIKSNDGSYLLFCWDQKVLWRLDKDLRGLKTASAIQYRGTEFPSINYFTDFLFQNDSIRIVYSGQTIFKINDITKTVTCSGLPGNAILGCLYYKDILLIHSNDELIFLDAATMAIRKKLPLQNTGGVRCFVSDHEGNIYVGSNKGVFKLDSNGKLLLHLSKAIGLPDECIYAMSVDKASELWCSTNKGIIKISQDKSILQLTKEDGLQENEFNTNVDAVAEDGEMFFGGVNGVSSFFPAAITGQHENIAVLFTNIKVNNRDIFKDSAVWNIKEIDLPYNQNSVAFDFIAMANNNPGQYIYQYKMKGIDDNWIQDDKLQTIRYFLPPGGYVLQVSASRYFNKDAQPLSEIHITIHPPYWKTWWFITLLSLMLLFILGYGINMYNRRQYQEKLRMFEAENKIRLERERISRDLHDNIGAYANAVIYNTELLEQEQHGTSSNDLIKDLRFASREIITSLRETIWALKKDDYSAEDCLLRIRNFIQPFTRYYRHIHLKVDGEAPKDKILHYDKALHLVRTIQEAVTNAIRHADAKNILITSNIENDSWVIRIKDDGKGFDHAEKTETPLGNGLSNMLQRAVEGGLQFDINSKPNSGTIITITC